MTKQPLPGARFKVTMANGEFTPDNEGLTSSKGLYTTDQNGQIILSKLLPGTYVVTEDLAPTIISSTLPRRQWWYTPGIRKPSDFTMIPFALSPL